MMYYYMLSPEVYGGDEISSTFTTCNISDAYTLMHHYYPVIQYKIYHSGMGHSVYWVLLLFVIF